VGALFVRFLIQGEKGRYRRSFEAMAASLDHGQNASPCFRAHFGDPKALQPKFLEWLKGAQVPWAPVFNEWEQTAEDRFLGAAAGVTTACRLKLPAKRLEATVEVPASGGWCAGLLLHFTDAKDFSVALADGGGRVVVSRFLAGIWTPLLSKPIPPPKAPGLLAFEAVRTGERVAVKVEGEDFGSFPLPGSVLGLALRDCEARFRGVRWETGESR